MKIGDRDFKLLVVILLAGLIISNVFVYKALTQMTNNLSEVGSLIAGALQHLGK